MAATLKDAQKGATEWLWRHLFEGGFEMVGDGLLIRHAETESMCQLHCDAREDRSTGRVLLGLSAAIRYELLEALRKTYEDEDDPHAPTISVPIHLLHADRRFVEWDSEASSTLPTLLEEVSQYALPFFDEYKRLGSLTAALESDHPRHWPPISRTERVELLPLGLAVEGRYSDAIELLDREIAARRNKPVGHRLGLQKIREKIIEVGSGQPN